MYSNVKVWMGAVKIKKIGNRNPMVDSGNIWPTDKRLMFWKAKFFKLKNGIITESYCGQCDKTKVCTVDDTPIFPQRKYNCPDANVCCQNQKNNCNWHLWIVGCLTVVIDFILLFITDNVCVEFARFERIMGLFY